MSAKSYELYMKTNAERIKAFLRESEWASLVIRYFGTGGRGPISAQPTLVIVLPSRRAWPEMPEEQYAKLVERTLKRCEEDAARCL